MKVTATYHGVSVTIVEIIPVGSLIYVAYIEGGVLKMAKDFFPTNVDVLTLATGATAV